MRQVFDQGIRPALRFAVGLEAFHATLARNPPCEAISGISLGLAVERGQRLAAMFDAHGESHVAIVRFRRFLCRFCVASARISFFRGKSGRGGGI